MKTDRMTPVTSLGVCAILAVLAFSIACVLTGSEALAPQRTSSIMDRLLGESRRTFGETFCIEADRYFHRGVPHRRERVFTDVIGQLAAIVRPETHEHLSGNDVCEMMPWLRFASWADAGNVEAYTNAAFWVAREKPGSLPQALAILDEARRRNPSDYRIPMERGIILLHRGDRERAERAFDLALRLWPGAERCSGEQKRLDRAALLNYRGFLYELSGDAAGALRCYREFLALRPDARGMREIANRIETGERGREEAEGILHSVFLAGPLRGAHEECSRTTHHEHGHDGEHHRKTADH